MADTSHRAAETFRRRTAELTGVLPGGPTGGQAVTTCEPKARDGGGNGV